MPCFLPCLWRDEQTMPSWNQYLLMRWTQQNQNRKINKILQMERADKNCSDHNLCACLSYSSTLSRHESSSLKASSKAFHIKLLSQVSLGRVLLKYLKYHIFFSFWLMWKFEWLEGCLVFNNAKKRWFKACMNDEEIKPIRNIIGCLEHLHGPMPWGEVPRHRKAVQLRYGYCKEQTKIKKREYLILSIVLFKIALFLGYDLPLDVILPWSLSNYYVVPLKRNIIL